MGMQLLSKPEGETHDVVREQLLVAVADVEEDWPSLNHKTPSGAKRWCVSAHISKSNRRRGIRHGAEPVAADVQPCDAGGCFRIRGERRVWSQDQPGASLC